MSRLDWRRGKSALVFGAEDRDEDSAAFVFKNNGTLLVSVAEEQAVDSYNSMFECTIHLTKEQAIALYEFLKARVGPALPEPPSE